MRPHRLITLLVACLLPVLLPAQVTFTWDPNGIVTGTGTGGGTWNTTNLNWVSGEALAWLNNGTAKAVFPISTLEGTDSYNAGGDYTIDVAANVQARGLGLGSVAWDSRAETTFSGSGSITLTDPLVTVESTTAIFNVPLLSNVGLTLDVSFNYGGYLKLNTANPDLLGLTTITEGTLIFNHPGALGPETSGNGIAIGANGTLNFNYVSGGDFSYTLADPITITGVSEFSRHLTIAHDSEATRSVTLSGPISLESDLKIQGGSIDGSGKAQIISSGVISGAGHNVLVEGDVQLSGTNTFTGIVRVGADDDEDGRLTIPVFNNDGVAGPLGAGNGLRIGYNNGEGGSAGTVLYSGATATSDRTIQIDGDAALGVTNSATTLTLTGVISKLEGSYGAELEKIGPGTLVLRGDSTYEGDTNLTNGTLIVGHNHGLGSNPEAEVEVGTSDTVYSDNLSLLLENGVTLRQEVDIYNENNDGGKTRLGLSGTGTATFAGEIYLRRNVEVDVGSGGTLNFTGYVNDGDGGGSIKKTGAGTAVFSNDIDLRGGSLDVSAGTVQLSDGVMLPSTAYVRSGAKLTGTPTMTFESGSLYVASGGTIQPGLNGTGTFTTENIYLSSGSNLQWQLASLTTSETPLISLSTSDGNTEIYTDAKLTVDLSLLAVSQRPDYATLDAFWTSSHQWMIISFASPTAEGNLAPGALNPMTVMNGSFSKGVFSTYMDSGGNLMLQFTPVPEPSTWVLLGLGAVALLLPRLRRRA